MIDLLCCVLQLVSRDRDKAARKVYKEVTGMTKPTEDGWRLQRAPYSDAVQLMAEADEAWPELYPRLTYLGQGASGNVA